jgi:uncharacterized membrane protein YhaH (DUF805 family)
MTSALLVLVAVAALSASGALLGARLGMSSLADTLAVTAALCGLAAFGLAAAHTVRRAGRTGGQPRP